jgi:hypothetical protein
MVAYTHWPHPLISVINGEVGAFYKKKTGTGIEL